MRKSFDSAGISSSDSTKLFALMSEHPQKREKDVGAPHDPYVQLIVQTSPGEALYEFLKQKDWICEKDRWIELTCHRSDCTDQFKVSQNTFGDKVTVTHFALG